LICFNNGLCESTNAPHADDDILINFLRSIESSFLLFGSAYVDLLILIHELDFRLFDQQSLDAEQGSKKGRLHMIIQQPLFLPFFDQDSRCSLRPMNWGWAA